MNTRNDQDKTERRFSLPLFVTVIILSLSGFLLALSLLAPAIWNVQLAASFPALVGTFLAMHFVNAFAEFFFHRYVLHAPLVPVLTYFWEQHTKHHALTRVVTKKVSSLGTREEWRIENRYPIVKAVQHRASFFPWYTFLVFGILFTPFFMLAQWFLPKIPIFLGGFAALAFSLFLYEVFHAIEHWPLEKWRPLLEHPRWGRWWKMAYAFHLRHHANIHSNEAISGFFGLPIPDFGFGTWVKAGLYEDGAIAGADKFKSPTPRFRFIRWLDQLAEASIRNRRQKQATTV